MSWKSRDIISIMDFSSEDISEFLDLATKIKANPGDYQDAMKGRKIALLFFEGSTRTTTSFRDAMEEMGGRIQMGMAGIMGTSVEKGESLASTIKMAEAYGSNAIVIRHPRDGSARYAADVADIPVINGGDGHHEHPTQNLMDLFTIYERFGRLDNLTFLFFNDLKYGRATRIILPLSRYEGNRFLFLSDPLVSLPDYIKKILEKNGRRYEEFFEGSCFPDLIREADVAYGSRTQAERFPKTAEGEEMLRQVRGSVVLTKKILEKAKPREKFVVMHPLPDDKKYPCIAKDVDGTSWAYYYRQAANGIPARQAILYLTIGGEG